MTTRFSSESNVLSYLGRSLYSPDPHPDFTLNEFRLYHGALTAAEIAATPALGPDQLLSTNAPALGAGVTGGGRLLTWPVKAANYTVMTTTNLAGSNWYPAAVTPQIVGQQCQVTLPFSGSRQYNRVQK